MTDAGRTVKPPPFYVKVGHKISHEKDAFPAPGRKVLLTETRS